MSAGVTLMIPRELDTNNRQQKGAGQAVVTRRSPLLISGKTKRWKATFAAWPKIVRRSQSTLAAVAIVTAIDPSIKIGSTASSQATKNGVQRSDSWHLYYF